MGSLFGEVRINEEFKTNLRNALLLLAALAPAIEKGDVYLMPIPFADDYSSVQDGARNELEGIEGNNKSQYYAPLYKAVKNPGTNEEGMKMVVGSVKVLGQICAKLGLTPVAGNLLVNEIIKQDYEWGIRRILTSNKTHRITGNLLQYDVPGVEKASFESVISLRNNEDAFNEWRREFGKVLEQAREEHPYDDEQFR